MQLFGHRGAAGEAPENTIAGVRHAIKRGITAVEIDLRLSADGQLVVVHDDSAKRTTGVNRLISRLPASDLAKLDARQAGLPWPRKAGCGIPTLKNYLRGSTGIHCYQLELKWDKKTDIALTIQRLAEIFPTRTSAKKIVITSFHHDFLAQINSHLPHLKLGTITYKREALKHAIDLACDYYCIHESLCSKNYIEKIRRTDMHICAWTVNNPDTIKKLFELGIDSIISDYPSMALPLIKSLLR